MVKIISLEKCDGCGNCAGSCALEVLEVSDKKVKVVDADSCTDCRLCAEVCPHDVLEIVS